MQLYCRNGVVLAWHDDGQAVPASAYGDGVTIIPYAGAISDLAKVGDEPAAGQPDFRQSAAPEPEPPQPAPVPASISDRQFAHGLWKQNVITFEEARDFLKVGEMPAALAGLVAQMPAAQRKDAELMITGSTSFERAHPFTAAIAAAFGWTDEVTDEFWTYAAAL